VTTVGDTEWQPVEDHGLGEEEGSVCVRVCVCVCVCMGGGGGGGVGGGGGGGGECVCMGGMSVVCEEREECGVRVGRRVREKEVRE